MTSTTTPSITTVADAGRERAIATIVTAFAADPPMRWVLPNPQQYLTYAPKLVRLFCGKTFEEQSAFAVDDYMGVALWLRPGVEPDEEGLNELLQQAVPEEHLQDVSDFFDELDEHHPKEPVWHLAMIGVDPARQGMGLGSALLEHSLAEVDREAKPAYLEASTERSRDLYARHGFEVTGTIQTASSPPMYAMLRSAR